jgi:hypothetical protein
MGAGKQSIIEGGGKGKDNEAEVSDQALHVKIIAGGGSGPTSDVNIAAVGGVAIGPTVPVSGTVSVVEPVSVDDNGGSLTVDGTVAVSSVGGTVTIQEPLSVDDNGGSLTVDGTVAVSAVGGTVTIQEPLSVDDNGGSLTVDGTVSITGNVVTVTPYARQTTVGSDDFVWPMGLQRRDTLNTIAPTDGQYTGGRCNNRGATWVKHDGVLSVDDNAGSLTVDGTVAVSSVAGTVTVGDGGGSLTVDGTVTDIPQRSAITQLVNAQVYNNVTTTTSSASFDLTQYRYAVMYFIITKANTPTDIQMILEFTPDAGATWCIWSVDQWTDLRYAAAQVPLNEAIPLNHVVGKTMRLRVVATGTTATITFTLTAYVEGIS